MFLSIVQANKIYIPYLLSLFRESCDPEVAHISVLPILSAVAKQSDRPCHRSIPGRRCLTFEKSYDVLGMFPSTKSIPDPEISWRVLLYAVSKFGVLASASGFGHGIALDRDLLCAPEFSSSGGEDHTGNVKIMGCSTIEIGQTQSIVL